MLTTEDFESWCTKTNISNDAKLKIENIRKSEPVRRVKGRRGNVCGTYPSVKMGLSIQWESHTLELHGVYLNEHDPDVLEYFDQPSVLTLNYKVEGKNKGSTYTPDYFEIRQNFACWVEWKYEAELVKISHEKPWKYVQDENGRWRCPPAEEYARKYGFEFHVRTESDLPRTFIRNIRYLEDFILDDDKGVPENAKRIILGKVRQDPGITLRSLLDQVDEGYTADDLYYLIVIGELFVDLHNQALPEHYEVNVYLDKTTFEAITLIKESGVEHSTPEIDCSVGQKFSWENQVWTILKSTGKSVTLVTDTDDITMPLAKFASLVSNRDFIPLSRSSQSLRNPENPEVNERFLGANRIDLETANYRYAVLQAHWRGVDSGVSIRTIREWQKKFRLAEQAYGYGYIGLLPQTRKRGNSKRKISEQVIRLINDVIEENYKSKKQPKVHEVWGELERKCKEMGEDTPSVRTLHNEIKKRPLEELIEARQGPRAGYQEKAFYWLLDKDTPRHGDRPFEIIHIDHTQLDVEAVSRRKIGLGRPWVTFAVDAFSRRVLAMYLTYDPPSYRSCMMVFRELIRKHNRKPSVVVVDNGKEFDSVYFDAFLNRYGIVKKKRPPHMSRFGSIGERMFGTTNTQFIHNLLGNTQLMKEIRKVSKSFKPKNNAIWTLELLYEFLSIYVYEVYDSRIVHSTLGRSPREEFALGMADSGYRKNTIIADDEEFYFSTLPTTNKGTAKVDNRYGIKINNLNYWNSALRDSRLSDKQVDIKFDPFNIGIAYAYVNKQWLQLRSDYYEIFRGHSVRTVQFLSAELKKQKSLQGQNAINNARELAQLLLQAQQQEEYLLLFEREEENKRVRELMESKASYLSSFKSDDFRTEERVSPSIETSHQNSLSPDNVDTEPEIEEHDECTEDDFEDEDMDSEIYEEVV